MRFVKLGLEHALKYNLDTENLKKTSKKQGIFEKFFNFFKKFELYFVVIIRVCFIDFIQYKSVVSLLTQKTINKKFSISGIGVHTGTR